MPFETQFRSRILSGPGLDLPPPYRQVRLREVGNAFAHAAGVAAELGAGTLVYVERFDLIEFAVVLEPDEPLRTARCVFYAGMAALGEALLAYAPPQKPVEFVWPGTIIVDGGIVGGGRLAWPEAASESAAPEWLVFGAMIRTVSIGESEPGLRPLVSALADEGFVDFSSGAVLEGFARHLMALLDEWRDEGFAPVARKYLMRLRSEKGVRREIDENGDLLVRYMASRQSERRDFTPALAAPAWLDPASDGPRS